MILSKTADTIFSHLTQLLDQLADEEYNTPLSLLSGNSIGKHVRHIVEFFDQLVESCLQSENINYDRRAHDTKLENDKAMAGVKIQQLRENIRQMTNDKDMTLEASYATDDGSFTAKTSFRRELVYNIEHAIHHMAMIKIAVKTVFPGIQLDKNFGVAYSTLQYRKLQSTSL